MLCVLKSITSDGYTLAICHLLNVCQVVIIGNLYECVLENDIPEDNGECVHYKMKALVKKVLFAMLNMFFATSKDSVVNTPPNNACFKGTWQFGTA